MESTGTPSDIPDEARSGLEVTLQAIQGLPDDATLDDITNLEKTLSDAEQKDAGRLRHLPPGHPSGPRLTCSLDDLGRPAGLADHRPAGGRPLDHAAGEVDGVVALLLQPHQKPAPSGRRPGRRQHLPGGQLGQAQRQL